MKTIVILFCFASLIAEAAPNFITQSMMKRRGLTDEQYEMLWSMGAHPRIEVAAARDWIFRASRYKNVKEWLEELGRDNDFAKLASRVPGLTETNEVLSVSNKLLRAEASNWRDKAESYWNGWTNSFTIATNYCSKYSSMSNRVAVAESLAQKRGLLIQSELKRLKDEKSDLEEKIASTSYVALRPWLRLKLLSVDASIKKLEEDDGQVLPITE